MLGGVGGDGESCAGRGTDLTPTDIRRYFPLSREERGKYRLMSVANEGRECQSHWLSVAAARSRRGEGCSRYPSISPRTTRQRRKASA